LENKGPHFKLTSAEVRDHHPRDLEAAALPTPQCGAHWLAREPSGEFSWKGAKKCGCFVNRNMLG